MKGRNTVLVTTSNIKDNPDMPRRHVAHDVGLVGRHRRHRNARRIVLWQEIDTEDRSVLRHQLPRPWQHIGMETECPISLLRFDVDDWGVIRLHGGKARVSPARPLTWAIVRQRPYLPWGKPWPWFVVLGTHWVSGAWTNPGQRAEPWRRAQWAVGYERTAEGNSVFFFTLPGARARSSARIAPRAAARV